MSLKPALALPAAGPRVTIADVAEKAGVRVHDPLTFAAVAAVLSMVALAACVLPAARASRVDPIVALRQD